jgi:hypothetical protein
MVGGDDWMFGAEVEPYSENQSGRPKPATRTASLFASHWGEIVTMRGLYSRAVATGKARSNNSLPSRLRDARPSKPVPVGGERTRKPIATKQALAHPAALPHYDEPVSPKSDAWWWKSKA